MTLDDYAALSRKRRASMGLPSRGEHNRWAPNCERFPTKVGPDTQYLIDLHRGETCPVCADTGRAAVTAMQDAMRLVPAEYAIYPAARGVWIEGYMAGALGGTEANLRELHHFETEKLLADAVGLIDQTIYANEDSSPTVRWRNDEMLDLLRDIRRALVPGVDITSD